MELKRSERGVQTAPSLPRTTVPALCKKMEIPSCSKESGEGSHLAPIPRQHIGRRRQFRSAQYCIVSNKGRLGTACRQKKAAVLAITDVPKDDSGKLRRLCDDFKSQFNEDVRATRQWGGGVMGLKTQTKVAKRQAAIDKELAKRAGL